MAWTTAGSRSGMSGYELHDQLSEQFFRPAGGYFANFSSSVGSTSEEIYSQQAVYFSFISGEDHIAVFAPYIDVAKAVSAIFQMKETSLLCTEWSINHPCVRLSSRLSNALYLHS